MLGRGLLWLAGKIQGLVNQVLLSVLPPRQLAALSIWTYTRNTRRWTAVEGNAQGHIFAEEARLSRALMSHVDGPGRLLDLFCGGGREGLLFARAGHALCLVDAVPEHVNAALDLIRSEAPGTNVTGQVALIPDDLRLAKGEYDAALLLYGAYSMVPGRHRRIAMLAALCAALRGRGRVLLSAFVGGPAESRGLALRRALALLTFGNRSLELGDRFTGEFVHTFLSESDLIEEFALGGLRVLEFGSAMGGQMGLVHILLEKADGLERK